MAAWCVAVAGVAAAGVAVVAGVGCAGAPRASRGAVEPDVAAMNAAGSVLAPLDAQKLGYQGRWATDLKLPGGERVSYVRLLGDVLVLVESPSNLVTAVSVRDGSILWRRVVGTAQDKLFAPVRSGDRLLINTERLLFSLEVETGKVVRGDELESLVAGGPAVIGDFAVFGGTNERVFAHDVKAGYSKWSYKMTGRFFSQPVVSGSDVFAADGAGVYALFRGYTGEVLWRGRTFARVSAQPVLTALNVYLPSQDHSLYVLNRATGQDRWIFRATEPLLDDPVLIGNTVFLTLAGRGLVALDGRSGEEVWAIKQPLRVVTQAGSALVLRETGSLRVVDAETGDLLESVPVAPLEAVEAAEDGGLLLVTKRGRVLRIDPVR